VWSQIERERQQKFYSLMFASHSPTVVMSEQINQTDMGSDIMSDKNALLNHVELVSHPLMDNLE
jgi:hypothetical protein